VSGARYRPLLMVSDGRPAPYLVCTYSFGEADLPTIRAAYDLGHATDVAKLEAAASCRPIVRVYSLEEVSEYAAGSVTCRLVTSLRT